MKFICDKNSLLNGVNIAMRGVSPRTTLPILQGIMIKTYGDSIILSSTDLEIGIECKINAQIKEDGGVVVSSKVFSELTRKLPDDDVIIETSDNNIVNIRCGTTEFTISGSDVSEFPEIPDIIKEHSFKTSQRILKEMIRKTVFCISQEQTRPILTGVLFEIYNNKIKAVALDGFRMAISQHEVENALFENEVTDKYSIVIPGKTLDEISKILDDDDSNVTIYHTNNQVLFQINNTKVISRLLEGNYMNYNAVLPREHKTLVKINRLDLMGGIERASLLAEGKNNLIKFLVEDEYMTISSNSEKGKMSEKINISMEGVFLEIAFNSRYLLEALRVIDEDELELYFISSINPLIIKPSGSDEYLYMILPVKLNG